MPDALPILPTHIEETVQAIAELHRQHQRDATFFQRLVDQLTRFVARPQFLAFLTVLFAGWFGLNLLLQTNGYAAIDPPPFAWFQDAAAILALYITVLILITQRREDQLSDAREQLTLELAIVGEKKSAKIIELLEEMRRDSPHLRDRHDAEAHVLAISADPQAVLDAIQEAHSAPRTDESEYNAEDA